MRALACSLAVAVVLTGALVSCIDTSPARPEPVAFVDVDFVYTSTLTAGDKDPTEAGVCLHHSLGTSRLELWRGGVTLRELYMRPSGNPLRAALTAERLPVNTELVAVVWDVVCCSHTGPCWPTHELVANGTLLTEVVDLGDDPKRRGLAFRLRSDGGIVQLKIDAEAPTALQSFRRGPKRS